MNKKALIGYLLAPLIVWLAIPAARGQSAFFRAVTNLDPVAYWPLQESAQPPAADTEPNLGSLGAMANAYYSSTNVYKGQSGSPADGGDASVYCNGNNGAFLAVPTGNPQTTVPAGPFTVEAWVNPATFDSYRAILSQSGANPGGLNGSTNHAGWVLSENYYAYLDKPQLRGWSFHVYNGQGAGNGQPQGGAEAGVSYNYTTNTWYYLAAVFDGTNCTLYLNGTNINSANTGYTIPMTGSYVPDTWDPLCIGTGRGLNNNRFTGGIDEVAIYTNALTAAQVQAHFNAASAGYSTTVLGDKPSMFWRMDAPAYTSPSLSAYPVASNYGSAADINGLYLAGTTPGLSGPQFAGLLDPNNGNASLACAFNGLGTDETNTIPVYTNGISSALSADNSGILVTNLPDSLNPITNFNVTAMCWFKANPADSRYQGLFGHGNNSWKLSLNSDGRLRWFPGVGGDFASSGIYNDGQWHFVVGVYANSGVAASPAGVLATNYIYVDGVLDNSQLVTNTVTKGNTVSPLLGGAPDYVASGNGNSYSQRYFAGSLAQLAYFTNALTADQVLNLYTNAGATVPPPFITGQPFPYPSVRSVSGGAGTYLYEAVVAAGGTPGLTYQWYYNSSSNYTGATALVDDAVHYVDSTTSQVTITNLTSGDSGYYFCVVGNGYGSTTSAIVNVQVYTAPVITGQSPSGPFSLFAGQGPSLSVTAQGQTNLVYQWYTNGVADTALGTASTYLVPAGQAQSGETFQCVVTNDYGSATSSVATLTFTPLPASVTGSAYATNLLALNPTVYFPMHESAAAAPGDIETNYGTLGVQGTGFYADWTENNFSPGDVSIIHQVPGALAGDSDGAAYFLNPKNADSYLLVPHTSPQTTLKPPFTVECWVYGTGTGFGDIISQDGTSFNGGNANNTRGIRIAWGGNIQTYGYATVPASSQLALNQWHYVSLTYDGTNMALYVDGSQVSSAVTTNFVPDSWDPLTIGAGLWNTGGQTRSTSLAIDEVAIYTNALDGNTIYTHYNDGANGPVGQYVTDVTSLDPVLYFRMDAPSYTQPDQSTWPGMTNYGAAPVNGVYHPGMAPGSVPGPNNGSGLFAGALSGTNATPFNGLSAFASAYDPNAFNVLGATTPLSFSLWFRGNPADTRYEALVSQGPGWQMAKQANGTLQFWLGSTYVNTHRVYNDGNWHQVVVTYSTNVGNIYVDGLLDGSGTNSALTNPPPTTAYSTCIGTDPRYLSSGTGAGRQFAGDICEMAFWNGTELNAGQISALYQASAMPPTIQTQPVDASANANTVFTNTVVASGSAPLSYQWYRNNQPLPAAGQTNLTFGATNASLVIDPVKSSDQSTNYYVVVSNSQGSVTSSVVSLTVYSSPAFTSEPIDSTLTNNILLYAGAAPTFTVATVGAAPTYYQWFTNGVAATAGSTSLSNYTFSPVQIGQVSFYCVASNFVGQTTSTVITASVLADPTAPYPQQVLMDNPLGYWRLNEPDDGVGDFNDGAIAHDYWGAYDGIYTNTQLGGVYTFPPPSYYSSQDTSTPALFGLGATIADNDAYSIGGVDFSAPAGSNSSFSVEAWVDGYQQTRDAGIVSKGYGNGGEQFDLDTGSSLAGSGTHAFRFLVRDASGAVHLANSAILPDPGAAVWHHLVGVCDEVNGKLTLYVDGAPAASASLPPDSGILASSRSMIIGSRPSNSTTNSNDQQFVGFVNDVAVYNYALSPSQIAAHYAAAGVRPNFTQLPSTNATADGYGTLTLPAGAAGTAPIGYVWQDMNNGTNVAAGSTNGALLDATLTVTNVPLSWNGDTLQLTVTNAYGSTNYQVTLTVYTNAPEITADLPPQVTIPTGKTYIYSIGLVGPQPYSYQWYNAATPIVGGTNATYSPAVAATGSTTYFVVVTNVFGATTSSVSTFTVVPQLNTYASYAYASNVLALNPVGYWPLQETNPAAPATTETNYGLLGPIGTAYYAGTNSAAQGVAGGNISFGQSGALTTTGDNDPAAGFLGGNNANETNSYLFVPITTPVLGLDGPVTYECWFNSTSGGFADLIGNGGLDGDGSGNWSGLRLSYSRGTAVQAYWYPGSGSTLASLGSNGSFSGQWVYCVVTYDGSTVTLYIDGTNAVSATSTIASNHWTPLSIGCGRWDGAHETRAYTGLIDEVAIYTNALSPTQIMNHYLAATTAGSNYVAAVTNDSPLLYYRMDGVYTNPSPVLYPQAVNYGSAPVNGAYQTGVTPGGVAGPTNSVFGTSAVAAPINGIFSCVDAGYDPAFNPTGAQPFTALTWFRGNPWDGRTQAIMGQGGNWAMNIDGSSGRIVWNLYSGGQVTSTGILNDGNWHFVAGVYDGTTNYLYVDGALDNSAAATAGLAGDTNSDLYLGGDSLYRYPQSGGAGTRYFAGALAQAAFFSQALTPSQIQALYLSAAPPVTPTISVARSGSNLVITYTGTLYESTSLTVPASSWTPVATNSSPYTVPATGAAMFYRAGAQ